MRIEKKAILARLRNAEKDAKNRARAMASKDKPKEDDLIVSAQLSSAIEQIKQIKEQLMSLTARKYEKVGKPLGHETVKVLSLSDLHVPFENPETILHALENHADADILVVNGDFLEQYAISRWGKSKTILLEWEYKIAIEWMKLFTDMFEEVHLVRGNHDDRLSRYISDAVDPMVNFMIEDDVLVKLANGYDFNLNGKLEKQYNFDNVYYTPGLLGWQTRIGKCIFAHPTSFSGVPMRTVISAATSFMTNESFQALVIGHTHKMGKLIWRDKLLIEQGCCCVPLDYQSDGKMKYLPQAFGYAVIYMDEYGNVDFEKSGPVYRGTGYPTKTDLG